MKLPLLLIFPITALAFSSCTTLQNRRDMYFPQKTNGPYTRMAKDWHGVKFKVVSKSKTGSGTGSSSDGKNVVAPQH